MKKKINPVLLFMHIPKTAGTSLRKIIEHQVPKEKRHFIYNVKDKFDFINFKNKNNLQFIFGHFNYADRIDTYLNRDYKFVTFMRDPVEQVISHYYHFYNSPDSTNPNRANIIKPEHLVSLDKFINAPIANNLQIKYISGILNNKLKIYPKKTLELAKYHIDHYFDFIGITEYYDDSIKYLCNRYGLDSEIKMLNVGERPKAKDISNKLIEKIKKRNQLDIKLYNYVLEKFSKKIK